MQALPGPAAHSRHQACRQHPCPLACPPACLPALPMPVEGSGRIDTKADRRTASSSRPRGRRAPRDRPAYERIASHGRGGGEIDSWTLGWQHPGGRQMRFLDPRVETPRGTPDEDSWTPGWPSDLSRHPGGRQMRSLDPGVATVTCHGTLGDARRPINSWTPGWHSDLSRHSGGRQM